jgi:hypothetical protein
MARKVQVFQTEADATDDVTIVAVATTHDALRALKPLGIRFETVTVDGGMMTVSAWLEEKEPKAKKERQALGSVDGAPKTARGDDSDSKSSPRT